MSRVHRTMNEAFGPYAKLTVEEPKNYAWPLALIALGCFFVIGWCII